LWCAYQHWYTNHSLVAHTHLLIKSQIQNKIILQ
jgi:hypothetical protein